MADGPALRPARDSAPAWPWAAALALGGTLLVASHSARGQNAPAPVSVPVMPDGAARDGPRAPLAPDGASCASGSCALGRALRKGGRFPDAEAELRRGVARAGGSPDVLAPLYLELARVFEDRGDFARTTAACRRVLALAGHVADGHACLAEAHLMWQRASEALSETALALAADPRHYAAKVAEGRAYDLELEPARAEAALRDALAIRPDGVEAHVALAHALAGAGRHDDAVAELRRAIELDPVDAGALVELAGALPRGPERTALLERATRARPSYAAAWATLAADRLAEGRIGPAKDALAEATRTDPRSPEVLLLTGKVALAEGRVDDARRAGEAVLKALPNSGPAMLLVADANAKKGEVDDAIDAYQAAWSADHGDPSPLVHASEVCHVAGRNTTARAFALRATEEFPRWAPAWAALGDALAAEADRAGARAAYAKALAAPDGTVDRARLARAADGLW